MTVGWKYVLLGVLLAGALMYLGAGVRAAAVNLHRLRSWRRFPATVHATADPAIVQVLVGSGREEITLRVPRTHGAGYRSRSKVTVIENPKNPE